LELAQSLGWVRDSEEGAALKDAHLQDLSFQQAEGAEDSGKSDGQVWNHFKKNWFLVNEECV
jgi:hypothetical protein